MHFFTVFVYFILCFYNLFKNHFRLFEEAANNLNMTSLTAFLASLCDSSKQQLHKITRTILEDEDYPGEHHNLPVNSLHLYRLQNVLMKVAHSDRPLIHLIKAWSVVSSYLVEVSTYNEFIYML